MKRLLIADGTPGLSETLIRVLSQDFEIGTCNQGHKVVQELLAFQPDVLVLDLMLPGADGISVLHTLKGAGIHPKVVATTCYISDFILAALERLGVSCVMLKPCDTGILAARILEVAEGEPLQDRQAQVRREANLLMLRLGLRRNLAGYRYLVEAIVLYDRDSSQSITKELYPAVGAMCGGNGPQAERAIRTCIQDAYSKRQDYLWRLYFPAGYDGRVRKVTNVHFIAKMTECIREILDKK